MTEFVSKWMKNNEQPANEPPNPTEQPNIAFVSFGGLVIGHSKKINVLIENKIKDEKAYEAGFNIFHSGQVYMKQITDNGIVVIVQNDLGKFDVWRETWSRKVNSTKNARSTSNKDIEMGITFDHALLKVKQYIGFVTKASR